MAVQFLAMRAAAFPDDWPNPDLIGAEGVVVAPGTDTPLPISEDEAGNIVIPGARLRVTAQAMVPGFWLQGSSTRAEWVSGEYRVPLWSPEGLEGQAAASASRAEAAADRADQVAGLIIATTSWNPPTGGSVDRPGTTANVWMPYSDNGDLTATFTAPGTGAVLVSLEGLITLNRSSGLVNGSWGLLDEDGELIEGTQAAIILGFGTAETGSQTGDRRFHATIVMTDLTPGEQYTYTWAAMLGTSGASAGSFILWRGGPMGPATMTVQSINPA